MKEPGHRTAWERGRLRAWGVATIALAVAAQLAGTAPTAEAAPSRHTQTAARTSAKHAHSRWHSGHRRATSPHGRPDLPSWDAPPPESTLSRYMHTVDPRRTHRLGCELGRRVHHGHERTDSLVVLAYGSPMHRHGRYGASLFGHFASSRRIGVAAVSFGRGFASCLHRTHGHLTLAVGTSNYGSGVTNRHGRIWASMVNRANHVLHGWALGRLVTVAGGNDIEPGWRGPEATRHWINGYRAVTSTPYYNFGGAADCPPIGFCQGDWTIEDVWYAAWGSGVARPLPEIYSNTGSNAEQWYRLSLYSYMAHGERMDIAGTMSQLQSCWDSHDRCRGISNAPNRSWSQLWHMLNGDPRTAQPLPYSTNISWRN